MTRQKTLRIDGTLRMILLVGILVVANHLAHHWFTRIDLTHEKVFSLSPETKLILGELQQPVEVRAFFTRDLQAPYNQYADEVKDKLEEYRAYSNGKVRFEFKDPTGDTELEEEARRFGIFPVKVDYRAEDQREIRKAFMGVAFVSGEKQEALPLLKSLESLEYDITRSILAVTSDVKKKKIGFLTGHQEPDLLRPPPQGGANQLRMTLEEKYEVTAVNTTEDDTIADDIDTLMIFAPSQPLKDRDLYLLDQFLMAGKSVGFMLAGHMADPKQNRIGPIDHNLFDLLGSYGITVGRDLVIDREQNGRRQFPVRQGRMVLPLLVNYPLVPIVTDMAEDHLVTRDLEPMAMPFTASVTATEVLRSREGGKVIDLLKSGKASTRKAGSPPPYDPNALQTPLPDEEPGPFTLALGYQGTLESAFKGKPVPSELSGRTTVDESPITRVVVVGGAEWLQGGFPFFLNMVDWLAQDERLVGIRTRAVAQPPLKKVQEWNKDERARKQNLVQLANVVGVPLALILFGVVRWRIRSRQGQAGSQV